MTKSNPITGHPMTTLHEERLNKVYSVLKSTGACRVLDLGCGSGALLNRLLEDPQFIEIIGLEKSGFLLAHVREKFSEHLRGRNPRLQLLNESYEQKNSALKGFEAAAMVETIEHISPSALSTVEHTVFQHYRPAMLYMTTPNKEYNPVYGLEPGEFREPDHKFEWNREKFQRWCHGVANRNAYQVHFDGIGDFYPDYGHTTQAAYFTRRD